MEDWTKDPQQVELFGRRSMAAGISRREFLKILAAAAGTLTATAACGSGAPTQGSNDPANTSTSRGNPPAADGKAAPDQEQILRLPVGIEPSSHDFNLDLYCQGDTELFAGLARFNPDYEPEPYVAERWETTGDGSTYMFHIKKGLTWSNGDPVTAQDFEWSFKRQLDPQSQAAYAAFLFDIKNAEAFNTKQAGLTRDMVGVKTLDDYTLEITLEGPRGYFPTVMAYPAALPAHRPSVEKFGDKWTEAANIVTNGPWKLVEWEHDKRLVFERNEQFGLQPKPKLRKRYAAIIDSEAQLAAYERNEIDRANVPLAEIKRLQADPQLSKELQIFSTTGTFYLAPSYSTPPFDQKGVRRALAYAIDREQIIKTVLQDVGQPAYTFVPPDSPGYLDPAKYPWVKDLAGYNPAKAMEMLKGTPYEGGKNWPTITITYRSDELSGIPAQVVQAIQAMLKENLNMHVELEGLEGRVFRDRMFAHKIQLNYVRWYMDYPDPNNNLFTVWYSNRTSGLRHEYKDPEFDALVSEASGVPSFERRMELYSQAEQRMLEDGGAVYIYYVFAARIYKPWVQGLPKNSSGMGVQDWNIFYGLVNEVFMGDHPDRPKLS